jgi:polysaccharide biosynthesis protein PslH
MAHILIAYKQFPAPSVGHAGGESLFRLMAALHSRGHRLTLVARITDDERRHLSAVEAICDAVHTVAHHRSRRGPRLLAFLLSYAQLRAAIRSVLREARPDLLHVETTQTALAALGLKRPPASYRTQDVNWFLLDQQLARCGGPRCLGLMVKRWLFRWLEPWLCKRYDLMLAISEGDRRLLIPTCEPTRLLLVPLTPAVDGALEGELAAGGEANLLFVGAIGRDHNQEGITWFLDHIWDRVSSECPETRLYIVGGDPPEALTARADGTRIIVTGFVDELAPWYRAATVFVSPLLVAGGLLQKVVDAMAMGVPIVATSVSNHGVGAVPGEHLLTADGPAAFAEAVVRLLRDPAERRRIGDAGRAFVEERYDLTAAVDRWEVALLSLVGGVR